MLRETVAACAVVAALAITAGALLGHLTIGVGLAAGILLGSLNGHAIAAHIGRGTPFVASTFVRLAAFSGAAIAIAILLGGDMWSVLLGVAGAQMLLAAAAVRQGLRA